MIYFFFVNHNFINRDMNLFEKIGRKTGGRRQDAHPRRRRENQREGESFGGREAVKRVSADGWKCRDPVENEGQVR